MYRELEGRCGLSGLVKGWKLRDFVLRNFTFSSQRLISHLSLTLELATEERRSKFYNATERNSRRKHKRENYPYFQSIFSNPRVQEVHRVSIDKDEVSHSIGRSEREKKRCLQQWTNRHRKRVNERIHLLLQSRIPFLVGEQRYCTSRVLLISTASCLIDEESWHTCCKDRNHPLLD